MSKIILDPSGERKVKQVFVVIENDYDFFKNFDSKSNIWIRGKELCRWAKDFFDNRRIAYNRLLSPHEEIGQRLRINPDNFSGELVEKIIDVIEKSPEDKELSISHILKDITSKDYWEKKTGWEHLLSILFEEFLDFLSPLVKCQIESWEDLVFDEDLKGLYRLWFEDKDYLIRCWLGIIEEIPKWRRKSEHKFEIPDNWLKIYRDYWEKVIFETEGRVLLKVSPKTQYNISIVAEIAYEFFKKRIDVYKKEYFAILAPYLSPEQREFLKEAEILESYYSFPESSDTESVIEWCASYLRHKKIALFLGARDEAFYTDDAKKFGKWYLENFVKFRNTPIEETPVNTRVRRIVSDNLKKSSVFWIIVDGLGFLEHEYLVEKLCKGLDMLSVECGPDCLLSVIPSITRIAKWSLITGKYFANSVSGTQSMRDIFYQQWQEDTYYATDSNINDLREQLKDGKKKLYCLDTTELDSKYHDNVNYQYLGESVRSHLDGLSRNILDLFKLYPKPEKLTLIISGDHGQLMGCSPVISKTKVFDKIVGGRVLFEKPEMEGNFIHLKSDRFSLLNDCWIIESNECFGARRVEKGKAVGVHGGLFPEEVLVGCSVLRMNVKYIPLEIEVAGSGFAKAGGEIEFKISNRNHTPAENIIILISELPEGSNRFFINNIAPYKAKSFKFKVPEWASPDEGTQVRLTGYAEYNFAGGKTNTQSIEGFVNSEIMYEKLELPDEW